MGYNMKHGNSAVPFRELGSSPAKAKAGPETKPGDFPGVDKLVDEDFTDETGHLYDIDAKNISTHKTEGDIKSQNAIVKQRCVEKGGTWNSKTQSCQ